MQGDILSNLPEPILHHIFSFLETIDVVRASAVSRTWRYFWFSIPYLSFNFNTVSSRQSWSIEKFNDFVNWVLMNRSVDIQSFRLRHLNLNDHFLFYRWMDIIVERNPQELDLTSWSDVEIKLPQCILNCGSLVSLKLKVRNCVLKKHTFPGFRSLKLLELCFVEFLDCVLLRNFVLSCPLLENFTMRRCVFRDHSDHKIIDVTAPSLKNLSLDFFLLRKYGLKVACPNLVSLNVLHLSSLDLLFEDMNSLRNLFVDLRIPCTYVRVEQFHHVTSNILKGTRNVEVLKLSADFLECLNQAVDKPECFSASFTSLKSLTVAISRADFNKQSLIYLLNCSPNLEALQIFFDLTAYCNDGWNMPTETFLCLKYHLKTVELIDFGVDKYKHDLVRFLLRNGHVLQKMNIYCEVGLENTQEIISKVMEFHRSSSDIALTLIEPEIDISFYD